MLGFGKNKPKVKTNIAGVDSIISEGTSVHGAMKFKGSIKVSGEVHGKMERVDDETSTSVTVDKTGTIHSDLACDNVIVAGTVNGDIQAGSVYITSTGRVNGKVIYQALQMEPGAQVNGELKCTFGDESEFALHNVGPRGMPSSEPALGGA